MLTSPALIIRKVGTLTRRHGAYLLITAIVLGLILLYLINGARAPLT